MLNNNNNNNNNNDERRLDDCCSTNVVINMQTQYYCDRCFINLTDFPDVKVYVDELSSAQIWQHK
jgi:hypothetical protein